MCWVPVQGPAPAKPDARKGNLEGKGRGSGIVTKDAKKEKKPVNKKKVGIICGTVAVVLIVAIAGMWVWHESPSFCGAICHYPMDEYLATYQATLGESTTDKYGNEVEDSSGMMSTLHAAVDEETGEIKAECLDCDQPVITEQVSEAFTWLTGSFLVPLDERDMEDLTEARGAEDATELCLNEDCHDVTREELVELTEDMGERNPHTILSELSVSHSEIACTDCHKGHRASVMQCTSCHTDAEVPDGWITAEEEDELTLYTEDE